MRKEMYLIRGIDKEDYLQFTARILKTAKTTARLVKPDGLKVTLTQQLPPAISIIPFKKSKLAVFSVYREDQGVYSMLQELLKDFPGHLKSMKHCPYRMKRHGLMVSLPPAPAC